MFRTRDFVLIFTTIAFLVMAISVTLFTQNRDVAVPSASTLLQTEEVTIAGAEVDQVDSEKLSREDRLKRMQEKIADSELAIITNEPPKEIVEEMDDNEPVITELQLCSNYQAQAMLDWVPSTITMETTEGARVYGVLEEMVVGSTTEMVLKPKLQLPQQFVPFGAANCVSTDIIGVALDNSLIRNSEASLYSVFSSDTLIGYALDGFPLYGSGSSEVDACGGRIALGQYRYELSSDRETILNCFAGTPQSFQ